MATPADPRDGPRPGARAAVNPVAPDVEGEIARITYRYLRWLLVLLPGVLLVVTVGTALQQGRLEPSISAYYGGPVRDVFVGVLVATAACMVAYQGASLLEDYTLNGAGFYAVFVALVPTNLDETLAALRADQTPDGVTAGDYVAFLRITVLVVLALCVGLIVVELRESRRLTSLWNRGAPSRLLIGTTAAVLLGFLALTMYQLFVPSADEVTMDGVAVLGRQLRIHDLAAILLIAALAVAVASHAWPERVAAMEGAPPVPPSDLAARNGYRVIFGLMVGGLPVALVVHRALPDHTVIFLEWYEIIAFGVFWVLETRRVRTVVPAPPPPQGRPPT